MRSILFRGVVDEVVSAILYRRLYVFRLRCMSPRSLFRHQATIGPCLASGSKS